MQLQSIQEIDTTHKVVLVRCDFNVPMDEFGNISDDRRIKESLSTINYLLENSAKVILVSHAGRPEGFNKRYSLKPIANRLRALLDKEVILSQDVVGEDTLAKAKNLDSSQILLLENIRFDDREMSNDKEFAALLASLADVYINDAFGVSHRAHSSIDSVTDYFDDRHKAAGFLLQREFNFFDNIINEPLRPFCAIVGGSKVSGKLEALSQLINKIDKLFIGGGMAFTFLKAQGLNVGRSLVEEHLIDEAGTILDQALAKGVKVYLPIDVVVTNEVSEKGLAKEVSYQEIPEDSIGVDIGKVSVQLFKLALQEARTILWNGPMGVFEIPHFSHGSISISHYLATLEHTITIIGGGDTANVVLMANDLENMSFISTGGGASLELIEGKSLPGIKRLQK